MRKGYIKGPVVACLIGLIVGISAAWSLVQWQGRALAQTADPEEMIVEREFERVLTLSEPQPVYMKGSTFIQIGELASGEPFAITNEDEAYYEIRLGNMAAFVRKGQGAVEKKKLPTLVQKERLAAVQAVLNTAVHADANLESGVLLELKEGYRYPVVQEDGDWYIITVGERPGYIHKRSVAVDKGVPVLVYHHILPREQMTTKNSTISLEMFEQQMKYLADQQFETLTAHQLYDYLEGRLVVPERAVLLTFDDGLLSTKEYAYPLLKQYRFTALQHIISSRTDRAEGVQQFDGEGPLQYLTASDLEELADVFEFEAHTDELHALNGNASTSVALDRSEEEILLDLERNLAQVPSAITVAYPYGQYNEAFITAAKEAGLLIGFTIEEGYANPKQSNYKVSRFGMTEKKSFAQFVAYVEGDMRWP